MKLDIKEVDIDNYRDVLQLEINPAQRKYVDSSRYFIAKSKYHPNHQPRAIVADRAVVGLVLYQTGDGDFEPHECEKFGFMIDRKFQGKGIGKLAMGLLVEEVKANKQFTWIKLSCDKDNTNAEKDYIASGFKNSGYVKNDGAIVFSIER